jgi:hypothetical protein
MLGATGKGDITSAIERGEYERIPYVYLRDVARWAAATRSPGARELADPPFSSTEAPQMIGTAIYFHYINRMVSVFLGDSPFASANRLLRPGFVRVGSRRFRDAAARSHPPGKSIGLVDEQELPADMSWARGSAAVAASWSALAASVEKAGRAVLSDGIRSRLSAAIESWSGEEPPLGTGWIDSALGSDEASAEPAARIALFTALAPYRLDRKELEREPEMAVAAASWGALAAARRVGSWIA